MSPQESEFIHALGWQSLFFVRRCTEGTTTFPSEHSQQVICGH